METFEDHVVMIALMLMFPKLASTSMTQKYYFGLFSVLFPYIFSFNNPFPPKG
jgi:hypothetical protein